MDPPDQPPPGPDERAERPPEGWRGTSPKRFWWIMGIGGLLVMLFVSGLLAPIMIRGKIAAERTEALSNAKQLGYALLEFEVDYGSYPSDATAPLVAARTGSALDFADGTSNAVFRQLIAHGLSEESLFYCVHPEAGRRPDGDLRTGKALEAGENGFSYVAGASSSGNPSIPLLATPMEIGTTRFWTKPHDGKAVVLRTDNSAEVPPIRASDHLVMIGGGRTLFDPANGVWPAGAKIDLRHPAK